MRTSTEVETMIVRLQDQIRKARAEIHTTPKSTAEWRQDQYAYIEEMTTQVLTMRWVLGMTDRLMSVDVVTP